MILENKIETRTEDKSTITDQAEVILAHRYYLKDTDGDVIENSSQLFSRVASAVASIDIQYGKLPVDAQLTEKEFSITSPSVSFK